MKVCSMFHARRNVLPHQGRMIRFSSVKKVQLQMSNLTASAIPAPWEAPASFEEQLELYGVELVVAAVAAQAVISYLQRPRGWARMDLLQVNDSIIAGKGLFASQNIPQGTVLGAYPGRPRSRVEMATKAETCPLAKQYVFQTDDGRYLDPTDMDGKPSERPIPGPVWPFPVNVALSYANEPRPGHAGPNTSVVDGQTALDVLFVANRDIDVGEEILIDYGTSYDRSSYSRPVQ